MRGERRISREEYVVRRKRISKAKENWGLNGDRRRSVPATEAVWRVWILEISIPDSRSNNMCARFEWWVDVIVISLYV